MQRTKPPFRADEVGSLLRPPRIKEARAKLEKGEIISIFWPSSPAANCFTPKPGSSSPACRPGMTPSA